MSTSAAPRPNHLGIALEYLARGFPIFPVCRPISEQRCYQHGVCKDASGDYKAGKHPLVSWKACQMALPSADEVTQWWTRWPDANIGMATGALPGIVVLDVDSRDARRLVMERGGLETPSVFTGKEGGTHFWLKHPGREVRNFAGKEQGVDFRGDGGYVLLPPSMHYSGREYRWAPNTFDLPFAAIPSWLAPLLVDKAPKADGDFGPSLDLDEIISGIGQGQRDTALWALASKLRGDNVPFFAGEMIMRLAARQCRPPFDEDAAVEKLRRAYQEYEPTPELTPTHAPEADPFAEVESQASAWEWRVLTAAEFVALDLPPIAWLLDGMVRESAIVLLYGGPGTLKTYSATQMALAIASGQPFLGQYAARRGRVLIVEEDTHEADYQQTYLRPMLRALDIAPGELDGWLWIAPAAGMRLDQAKRYAALEAWIAEHRPILVVLDAFYLLHETEGMTAKDLNPVLERLRALRALYGCAFIVIDHNRKKGSSSRGGGDDDDPVDRLYGGRPKSAAADAMIEALAVKGEQGVTYLHSRKLRGAQQFEPLRLRLVDGALRIDGTTPTTDRGVSQVVYEWLLKEGGSRTKEQMANGCSISPRSVDRAIDELTRRRLIKQVGKHGRAHTWVALTEPSDEPPATAFDLAEELY